MILDILCKMEFGQSLDFLHHGYFATQTESDEMRTTREFANHPPSADHVPPSPDLHPTVAPDFVQPLPISFPFPISTPNPTPISSLLPALSSKIDPHHSTNIPRRPRRQRPELHHPIRLIRDPHHRLRMPDLQLRRRAQR